jgi:hypothetical protein
MNLDKIQYIQLSLLQKETEPNKKTGKADYLKKKTAKFTIPNNFPKTEEMFEALVEDIYKDLMINAPKGTDSLGIWIKYDTYTLENAISLNTLRDIVKYSKDNLKPIFEFFKITIGNNGYMGPESN